MSISRHAALTDTLIKVNNKSERSHKSNPCTDLNQICLLNYGQMFRLFPSSFNIN